jgi:ABC-type sugar transport system ATPase subunit
MINLGLREELRKYAGHEVTIGIRPESLIPGDGPIKGNLELVEHLGPETILYVRANNTRIIAKAHPNFKKNRGEKISLTLRDTGIHFFYKGKRINRA